MKTSWDQIVIFDQTAAAYLADHKQQDRFGYAIEQCSSQLPALQKRINKQFTTIEINLCETKEPDGKGAIVRDDAGRLTFTRENLIKANEQKETAAAKEDFEVEPYFATSIPSDLTEAQLTAFAGFVIKLEDVSRLRAEREARIFGQAETTKEQPNGADASDES